MKDLILIGGAEGMGKSTLAKQLAAHFQVPWISTDQIRTILKVEEPDEVKRMALVWEGVAALARSPHPWEGAVIEGTAILPDFVARDLGGVLNIKSVFLIQDEQEQVSRVVSERSKLPFINTKTPEQQALKIEKITAKNREVKERARALGMPCVVAHREETFKEVVALLEERGSKEGIIQ